MFESHQSLNQAIWISGLSDHRTRLFEAQEASRTRKAEHSFAASFALRRVLGSFAAMLAGLVGMLSALRRPAHAEKRDASTEPGSLQACC